MEHKPDYVKIAAARRAIDMLEAWVKHELQPQAYESTADTLSEILQKTLTVANK